MRAIIKTKKSLKSIKIFMKMIPKDERFLTDFKLEVYILLYGC